MLTGAGVLLRSDARLDLIHSQQSRRSPANRNWHRREYPCVLVDSPPARPKRFSKPVVQGVEPMARPELSSWDLGEAFGGNPNFDPEMLETSSLNLWRLFKSVES